MSMAMQEPYLLATLAILVSLGIAIVALAQVQKFASLYETRGAAIWTRLNQAQGEIAEHVKQAIEDNAPALLSPDSPHVQSINSAMNARVKEIMASEGQAFEDQLMAKVQSEATAQLNAAGDLVGRAEAVISDLNAVHGKALRAVRTLNDRVRDSLNGQLWDEDGEDDDEGGGPNDLMMGLAANLPAEVRQGIIDHAPPDTRAQVNLLFAAADARSGNTTPTAAPGAGPQAPQPPPAPAGIGI